MSFSRHLNTIDKLWSCDKNWKNVSKIIHIREKSREVQSHLHAGVRIPGVRVSHPGQLDSDLAIPRSSPLDRGNFMGCFPIHPCIFLISTLEPLQITSDLMKPSKKRQN